MVCLVPIKNQDADLAGTRNVTISAVGSYPAVSPLPSKNDGCLFSVALSVIPFLGGIPGYYPAPCSMKFGLSSPQEISRRAIAQPEPIFMIIF